MGDQSWKFAVEIEQLDGMAIVRTIEDGNVSIRTFDNLTDAESFAEGERLRLNITNVAVRR